MTDKPEPDRRGPPRGLTFVNVTFPGELPLLRLQARSMGLYLPGDLVAEVLNIVNATDEAPAHEELEAVRGDYGPLAGKVRNVTASEVFAAGPNRVGLVHWPKRIVAENPWLYARRRAGWRGNDGWQMQQALKLGAARIAAGDDVVILDSKNIFLAPMSARDFMADTGQPLARFDHGKAHLAQRWLGASIKALGLDPALAETRPILSILTPAVFERRFLTDLLDALEAREGPVQGVFAMPWNRATEFMLITGWSLKGGGLARYFEEGLMDPFNLNYRHTEEFRLRRLGEAVEGGKLVTPHRAVMTSLSPELRAGLATLLADRGVVDGPGAFDEVVDDLRRRNPGSPRQ
jgi:hypothetical protein